MSVCRVVGRHAVVRWRVVVLRLGVVLSVGLGRMVVRREERGCVERGSVVVGVGVGVGVCEGRVDRWPRVVSRRWWWVVCGGRFGGVGVVVCVVGAGLCRRRVVVGVSVLVCRGRVVVGVGGVSSSRGGRCVSVERGVGVFRRSRGYVPGWG